MERNDQLHKNELEKIISELGRERHKVEQCQKQLTAEHHELVEHVKKIGANLVDELTKDGSVFSKVLNLKDSTFTK